MSETNPLGGKNPNGLYVPLSEDELEASYRAAERGIVVKVEGWGSYPAEKFHVGEHRVGVEFALRCPEDRVLGMTTENLRLQVETTDGIPLFSCATSAELHGRPVHLLPEQEFGLTLEIEVHHCNPEVVKTLKSGATGLTSRRIDPHTGRWDGTGNMRLDEVGLRALHELDIAHQVRAARARR